MRIELRGINKLLSEIHRKQKTEQEAKGVVKEHTAAMHQKLSMMHLSILDI